MGEELTFIATPSFSFGELAVPCVVGRGALSVRWRHEVTDRLRDELSCGLVVIEDAGHTAHRMQPKGFADFARHAVALGQLPG
jgi:pimeloyl-ACP methyl ester carboxylesterase